MNTDIHKAAKYYGLYDGDVICGFCAVIHFPHPKNKKIRHIHRLVILPDYQGIGLGKSFVSFVASLYEDFDVMLVTSAKNLVFSLSKDKNWKTVRIGKSAYQGRSTQRFGLTSRQKVVTATFKYIKE